MRNGSAASAGEALSLLKRELATGHQFDFALVDLPVTEAVRFSRMIQGLKLATPLRLLWLASTGERPAETVLQAEGWSAALAKPVKPMDLLSALARISGSKTTPFKKSALATVHEAEAPARRQTLRVLLAEDNPVNQKVAMKILERLGYEADVAANGQEVLSALKQIPYDVILMDCQMPEMDGYEATRLIRQMAQDPSARNKTDLKRIYIIALTANAMAGDRDTCLAAGMDDYISKPIRREDLQAALERTPQAPKPAATSVPPVVRLNSAILNELRDLREDGGPDPLAEIIQSFLSHAPQLLAEIQNQTAAGQAEAVRQAAHSLKGSAANLGAEQLARFCGELEKAAKEARLNQFIPLTVQIESELEFVRSRLTLELNT